MLLKFKDTSRKFFYWLQEPKDDKDEEYLKKVRPFKVLTQGSVQNCRTLSLFNNHYLYAKLEQVWFFYSGERFD